jgi:hypothetical protein
MKLNKFEPQLVIVREQSKILTFKKSSFLFKNEKKTYKNVKLRQKPLL